jgi:hypothetical protein
MPYQPFYILYQSDSIDGFTAAFMFWKKLGGVVRLVPCSPYRRLESNIGGKHLIFVGFVYSYAEMLDIASRAKSVLLLDHRSSVVREFIDFYSEETGKLTLATTEAFLNQKKGSGLYGVFDRNLSTCAIAHRFCYDGDADSCCAFCKYVQDNVMGAYVLPDTREIYAAISSYEFDMDVWSELTTMGADAGDALYRRLVAEGEVVLRQRKREVNLIINTSTRDMEIGGYHVKVANASPHVAERVAEELDDALFGASYHDTVFGRKFTLKRRLDFRPYAIDVGEVAKQYGGKGDETSATFTIKYADAAIYPELML